MIRILSVFAFIIISCSSFSQKARAFCSKYKTVTSANRLLIEDLRSDSLDIINTSLDLDMTSVATNQIACSATLTCQSNIAGLGSITFDFEGLTVDSVLGGNVSGFLHQDSILRVGFSNSLNQGDNVEIEIYYHGNPMKDASGWGGFYFSGNFSWNLGVGFADDPHSYGRIWFPCFDNFIERSTFDFKVKVMNDRRASCNGLLTQEVNNNDGTTTYYWELSQAIPSYLACVAVGPYISVNSSINGENGPLPVQIHGRPSDSSNIVSSFPHLDEAVLKFEEAFGPYRFDKVGYSLVPFNSGAMEHATNITYPISAANGGLSQEDLMAHELAHMWWGDNITCQTDGDMWINEGWASFWHYKILHDLKLPDSLHLPFLKMHNAVVRPHLGGVNPYHVGFYIFQKMEREHGLERCFEIRDNHDDVAALRMLLDEEDFRELNFFAYENKKDGSAVITEVTDHDEMDDTIEFEGTINGKSWTATKEWQQDGAIFTSVYDENDDTLPEDESAYNEVITAINDYMEEEGLEKEEGY